MNKGRVVLALLLLVAVAGIGGCFLFPNTPPTAAFEVEYNTDSNPLVVVLDASGSSDPDGDEIETYMWSFGDNVTILTPLEETKTVHVPTLTVSYPVEDTYHVELVVIDAAGKMSDPVSHEITVPNTG